MMCGSGKHCNVCNGVWIEPTARETRFICTKAHPSEKVDRATHPDAVYLRDKDYGDGECTAVYKCPNCGLIFEVEIAQ